MGGAWHVDRVETTVLCIAKRGLRDRDQKREKTERDMEGVDSSQPGRRHLRNSGLIDHSILQVQTVQGSILLPRYAPVLHVNVNINVRVHLYGLRAYLYSIWRKEGFNMLATLAGGGGRSPTLIFRS